MVSIKNLQFSFGNTTILKDISMDLEEGKIYGLLGENGVGKTTLLTLLCGLKKPEYGTIDIDGQKPYDREPSFLENIYYLPDEVEPIPYKAIDFASDRGRFWRNFDLSTFLEIMKLLENNPNQQMERMSLGQLKKTYISFALACRCKYIIMDEPTNGLDIPSKAQFRKAITRYTSETSTILISTHQVRDLDTIVDPIIILDRRTVLLNASIDQISQKLFFDYTSERNPDALYSEMTPGCSIQVSLNKTDAESKVNIEALFNTAHIHKSLFKNLFK